jgi:hypothetical protein
VICETDNSIIDCNCRRNGDFLPVIDSSCRKKDRSEILTVRYLDNHIGTIGYLHDRITRDVSLVAVCGIFCLSSLLS